MTKFYFSYYDGINLLKDRTAHTVTTHWCMESFFSYIWWLVRVILVVAFGFLLQNVGRWYGPTNCTLSFYECRFSGGDTITCWRTLKPNLMQKTLKFLLMGGGDIKTLGASICAIAFIRAIW